MPPEGFIWDEDGRPYWRSGPWNGNFFVEVPTSFYAGMYSLFSIQNNTLSFLPQDPKSLDHMVLTYDGVAVAKYSIDDIHKLDTVFTSIESECDVYGKCGPFGICNPNNSPICSCLEGFEPTNSTEWINGNWTWGCTRRTPLQCRLTGTGQEEKEDGFLRIQNVKVPDHAEWLSDLINEDGCRRQCQAQCSCLAYSFYTVIGCMIWNQTLMDIQEFNTTAANLSVRWAHSELADPDDDDGCRRQCQGQCSCLAYSFYVAIGCMTWNQTLMDIQEYNTPSTDLHIRLPQSELAAFADKNRKQKTIVTTVVITGAITFVVVTFLSVGG